MTDVKAWVSFENIDEDWFENQESSITIEPYETELIYFLANSSDQDTQISLTIYPRHHEYAQKELTFTVINSQGIVGDINGLFLQRRNINIKKRKAFNSIVVILPEILNYF